MIESCFYENNRNNAYALQCSEKKPWKNTQNEKLLIENYDNVYYSQLWSHSSRALNAETSEAERRATTSPKAGLDEGQLGGSRSAPLGRIPSHTTN